MIPSSSVVAFILGALAVIAMPLHAEPVRLRQDGGQFAQGWLFTDHRGVCRIVTAGHVLDQGGKLTAPVAVDGRGREIVTVAPRQPDPRMDIAFLEARPTICSTDSLSEADADRRLSESTAAFLEFVGLTEIRTLPLVRRARARDESGGRIVLFEPSVPGSSLTQGISGGAVVDAAGKLLAIVFEVDPARNHAFGVRSDVISVLLRELPAPQQDPSVAGWSTWYGKTVDPQRGVDAIVGGARGWTVEPDRGYVTFGLRFKQPLTIGSVAFRVDEGSRGQVSHVEISGSASATQPTSDWPTIGSCKPPPGSITIFCDFMPRSVHSLRIQARVTSPQVTFSNLTVAAPR
jgi:hypothetical protein